MILTLCGSARYEPYWHEANKQLGLAGHICFSLMTFPSVEGAKTWYTEDQKWTLDLAHFAKIDASDGVVMLNIDNYLGESSLRELKWARMKNKQVFWVMRDERMIRPGPTRPQISLNTEFFVRGFLVPGHSSGEWLELIEAVKEKQFKLETELLKVL